MSRPTAKVPANYTPQPFSAVLQADTLGLTPAAKRQRGTVLGHRDELFDAARKHGYAQGHTEGFEAGLEVGRQQAYDEAAREAHAQRAEELAHFHDDLETALTLIEGAMQRWYAQAEQALEQLSLDLAERIVQGELKSNPEANLKIVRAALGEVTHALEARIRINPFHSELLRQYSGELLNASMSLKRIEVLEDPSVEGGCVIDTEGGRVDAQVSSQVEALREELRKAA